MIRLPCLCNVCAYQTHSRRSLKCMSLLTSFLSSPTPTNTNRRKRVTSNLCNLLLLFVCRRKHLGFSRRPLTGCAALTASLNAIKLLLSHSGLSVVASFINSTLALRRTAFRKANLSSWPLFAFAFAIFAIVIISPLCVVKKCP